jgi:multisubunit Na+/H+ antiporter MnhE subunit
MSPPPSPPSSPQPRKGEEDKEDSKTKSSISSWSLISFIWWIVWRLLVALFILRYVEDKGRDIWTYIAIILFPEFWFLWEIWKGRVKIVRYSVQPKAA